MLGASKHLRAITVTEVIPTVTDINVSQTANGTIFVSFTYNKGTYGPASPIFDVYATPQPPGYNTVGGSTNINSITLTGLSLITYYIKVSATVTTSIGTVVNIDEQIEFTLSNITAPPSEPTNFTALGLTDKAFILSGSESNYIGIGETKFSWSPSNANGSPITHYVFEYKNPSDLKWYLVSWVSTATLGTLPSSGKYEYTIKSLDTNYWSLNPALYPGYVTSYRPSYSGLNSLSTLQTVDTLTGNIKYRVRAINSVGISASVETTASSSTTYVYKWTLQSFGGSGDWSPIYGVNQEIGKITKIKNLILIGGGGAGGRSATGGGGGAGEVLTLTDTVSYPKFNTPSATSYKYNVGTGGIISSYSPSTNGGNTTFSTYKVNGGGAGGGADLGLGGGYGSTTDPELPGKKGGSGGGASCYFGGTTYIIKGGISEKANSSALGNAGRDSLDNNNGFGYETVTPYYYPATILRHKGGGGGGAVPFQSAATLDNVTQGGPPYIINFSGYFQQTQLKKSVAAGGNGESTAVVNVIFNETYPNGYPIIEFTPGQLQGGSVATDQWWGSGGGGNNYDRPAPIEPRYGDGRNGIIYVEYWT